MDLTESRVLRGGRPCWTTADGGGLSNDELPDGFVDVAIVGAGIMGTMLAERLASSGRRVVLLDRRPPAQGSTAASTALVMWSADVPLS
ncbi:MAG: FAD-binding oxidoreductase, partial [Sphingomonadales bacterium]|nr:FAD-binding oxidoreductase [Sphingomonadales bacterium]